MTADTEKLVRDALESIIRFLQAEYALDGTEADYYGYSLTPAASMQVDKAFDALAALDAEDTEEVEMPMLSFGNLSVERERPELRNELDEIVLRVSSMNPEAYADQGDWVGAIHAEMEHYADMKRRTEDTAPPDRECSDKCAHWCQEGVKKPYRHLRSCRACNPYTLSKFMRRAEVEKRTKEARP